jgi:hypothetical protein
MTLKFGCIYRHTRTGVKFRIDEIWVRDNPIEGGISTAVRVVILDEEETTCVVGETQVARWWPHLELIGNADQETIAAAYRQATIEADAGFPWCPDCKSYHHRDNPTCFKLTRAE